MKHSKTKFSILTIVSLFTIIFITGCGSSSKVTTSLEKKAKSSDYLGEGVVLAAFYAEDGGFSETRYYPAEIVTPASDNTKGECLVRSLVGDFDVAEGEENWTDKVITESHPAQKDELEAGMKVLYTKKSIDEGLATARWNRGVISSVDELYKGIVNIDHVWHLDRPDESDRTYDIPIEAIRVIDEAN